MWVYRSVDFPEVRGPFSLPICYSSFLGGQVGWFLRSQLKFDQRASTNHSQPPSLKLTANHHPSKWTGTALPPQKKRTDPLKQPHRIHVWYIYLHLPWKWTIHVGKYTVRPMDPLGTNHQFSAAKLGLILQAHCACVRPSGDGSPWQNYHWNRGQRPSERWYEHCLIGWKNLWVVSCWLAFYGVMFCYREVIWYDMIWYDMIWYDMIWYEMIWYDMIWYLCIIYILMHNTWYHDSI